MIDESVARKVAQDRIRDADDINPVELHNARTRRMGRTVRVGDHQFIAMTKTSQGVETVGAEKWMRVGSLGRLIGRSRPHRTQRDVAASAKRSEQPSRVLRDLGGSS